MLSPSVKDLTFFGYNFSHEKIEQLQNCQCCIRHSKWKLSDIFVEKDKVNIHWSQEETNKKISRCFREDTDQKGKSNNNYYTKLKGKKLISNPRTKNRGRKSGKSKKID